MKVRSSLYVQTLTMLSLYLALLVAAAFLAFNAKFGIGLEAIVNSPLGDRVNTIADAIGGQLRAAPRSDWNQILKGFSKNYNASFYLFDPVQGQLAGDQIELPKALSERLMMPPPGPPPGGFGFAVFRTGQMRGPVRFDGPPGPDHFPPPPFAERTQMLPGGPPELHVATSDFGHHPHFFAMAPHMLPKFKFVVRTDKPSRVWLCTMIAISDPFGEGHEFPAMLLASCENIWETGLLFDFGFVASILGAILLLSFLFWVPFVYRITHALSELTKVTEKIADGQFDSRLKIKSRDEIGRLSDAVNSMATKLESFVFGQKRFLGAISHELRTPIARLQMALELLEASSTQDQKSLLGDIREEVEEMKSLVGELLAFSKAGMQGAKPSLELVNLKEIMAEVLPGLGAEKSIECDLQEGITVLADPLLLGRSLSNVLRNSLRYGGEFGPIRVKAVQIGSEVAIVIADDGPGVPEEALQHLGEPFYRPEESRSRQSGGVGLGLAIVKSCVEACQGVVAFRNRVAGGFEVELRLKAA
jgi:two-component system, OmpR family, sensor histidine kinase CpxA